MINLKQLVKFFDIWWIDMEVTIKKIENKEGKKIIRQSPY
jgi:hypothetical protein